MVDSKESGKFDLGVEGLSLVTRQALQKFSVKLCKYVGWYSSNAFS